MDPVPEPSTFAIWSLLGAIGFTVGWWRGRRTGEGETLATITAEDAVVITWGGGVNNSVMDGHSGFVAADGAFANLNAGQRPAVTNATAKSKPRCSANEEAPRHNRFAC